jgi:2,4-dienoyl-CoA reductase-like NADH-dependent reductase (Old Yellow Enzyme family)
MIGGTNSSTGRGFVDLTKLEKVAEFKHVLQPLQVKSMRLRNRIVYPPIGSNYSTQDGYVSGGLTDYLSARALSVGLVTTEVTIVRATGGLSPNHVSVYDDKFIPGLAKLAQAIQAKGAAASVQIVDYGARAGTCGAREGIPLAPSKIPAGIIGVHESIEMTKSQIKEAVERYGEAARRVYQAGFDTVEIHGAHMYLISQFLSGFTNKRTDEYGGSIENRSRFLVEILEAVKERVHGHFPIMVRMNGIEPFEGGLTIEDAQRVAQIIENTGVDIISVSRIIRKQELKIAPGKTFLWSTAVPDKNAPEGCNVFLAEAIKKVVKLPVMTAGKIFSAELAEKVLSEGKADLIGMARQLIADPDTVIKELDGRKGDIRRCKEDLLCQTSLGASCAMKCSANKALPPENTSTPI